MSGEGLVLSDVSVTVFGHDGSEIPLLSNVSLSAQRGEILCLTGRSGTGKTTLLRVIHGQVKPVSGQVKWNGEQIPIEGTDAVVNWRNLGIGYASQAVSLIGSLTLLENVLLPAVPSGRVSELSERALGLIDYFGISNRSQFFPRSLSGGEAQRALLVRSLIMDPPLLLADEPTSNLDAAGSRVVMAALRDRARSGGVVVVASHDPLVIDECDFVLDLSEYRP